MTQLLNDELMSSKAEAGRQKFNPVAVAIEQLDSNSVEGLQLKDNNQHWLYGTFCLEEDGEEAWRGRRQERFVGNLIKSSLSLVLRNSTHSLESDQPKWLKNVKFEPRLEITRRRTIASPAAKGDNQ